MHANECYTSLLFLYYILKLDIVCFKEQAYDVDESKRVKLDLTLSIPLPFSLRVTLKYRDVDATSSKLHYCNYVL